ETKGVIDAATEAVKLSGTLYKDRVIKYAAMTVVAAGAAALTGDKDTGMMTMTTTTDGVSVLLVLGDIEDGDPGQGRGRHHHVAKTERRENVTVIAAENAPATGILNGRNFEAPQSVRRSRSPRNEGASQDSKVDAQTFPTTSNSAGRAEAVSRKSDTGADDFVNAEPNPTHVDVQDGNGPGDAHEEKTQIKHDQIDDTGIQVNLDNNTEIGSKNRGGKLAETGTVAVIMITIATATEVKTANAREIATVRGTGTDTAKENATVTAKETVAVTVTEKKTETEKETTNDTKIEIANPAGTGTET
ncbi:hypothetical protein HK405_008021, partial [Cladochytrium tenue]